MWSKTLPDKEDGAVGSSPTEGPEARIGPNPTLAPQALCDVCPACWASTTVEGLFIDHIPDSVPPTFARYYGGDACGAEWTEEYVYRRYRLNKKGERAL